MEYRKKGQSSISHRSGKNYDGKPATLPTTKKAGPDSSRKTYDDQGREIKKSSGNNDFNVDKNALSTSQQMKLDAARKKFSPASMNTSNKNKAPFKMGGYGSKNK
jgi:hypothetical protein